MKRRLIAIAIAIGAALAALLVAAVPAAGAPVLSVEMTRAPATINRGDEFVSYEVKVKNTGPDASTAGLSVSLQMPAGLTLARATGSGWSCDLAAKTCTSSSAIAPGGSYPVLKLSEIWIEENAPDTVLVKATTSGGGAGTASAENSFSFGPRVPFGLQVTDASACTEPTSGGDAHSCREAETNGASELTQAGAHPFAASATFKVNMRARADGILIPVEDIHSGVSEIPAGVVGNPAAAEALCTYAQLQVAKCPADAAVGGVFLDLAAPGEPGGLELDPAVYRMTQEAGYPASFGFFTVATSFVVRTKVRSDGDYGITAVIPLVPSRPKLYESVFTFCGFGAKAVTGDFKGCKKRSVPADKANLKPFVTLGTNCAIGAPLTRFGVDSWIHRGALQANGLPDLSDPNWATLDFLSPPLTGCETLSEEWVDENKPSFGFQPDTHAADTPAAYTAKLHIPQEGLEDPEGLATSHLKDTTVTLPAGISLNPAIGDGLAACSSEQIGLIGTGFPAPNRIRFDTLAPRCPANSKVGLATIQTPLLEQSLHGAVYLATQRDNPFGSDYAIYLTVEEPEVGVIFKLAGEVVTDPLSGQITTTFADNPQLPFSDLDLEFFGGGRSALSNPSTCGAFTVQGELTPWSAKDPENPLESETARTAEPVQINSGPGGSACVSNPAQRPFGLGLEAGARSPLAGAHSPFSIRITRPDGAQELERLQISPPPGFVASLRGIPYCSEAQIKIAKARAGKAEQASPSCPAASAIGSLSAGAGAGPTPFYAPGKLYLAGPYKGAPLSVVAITPAVAGPFDLGNVVIQSALQVDPASARITAITDSIPQIVRGVPLRIRDVRIDLDRPSWAQNPTSCEAMAVDVTAFGANGAVSRPTNRFQVDGCERLGFAPKLTGFLKGGTKRDDNPAFVSVLSYPEGAYANVSRAAVTLPHSAFLDQSHIRTVCTRVQFAAGACPAGSIYGNAEATTPLLDEPLTGNAYLRSSSNKLPDLVIALRGPARQPIAVNLVGRIDSVNGGIRTTFETVPDAPVSKFVLRMFGGKRGLLVNSRNLCAKGGGKMAVRLSAHNGLSSSQRPPLKNQCPKKKPKRGKKSKG